MRNKRSLYLVIGVIAFVMACNPSAKMVKEGDQRRAAGNHEEATNYYYNALLKKPRNIKAKEGLALSAQQVLNEKFNQFNKLVVENNVDEAMKTYKNAERYFQTAKGVGVDLRWPGEYDEVYLDIRAEYISKLYDEALVMMNDKRYEQAERVFERIGLLDSSYKGITVLRLNTVLDPLYQAGISQLNQAKYKQAYLTFSKIVQQDESYKDAKARKDEAMNKATTTVGVFPVGNAADPSAPVAELGDLLNQRMMQRTFAYVKVLDPKELKQNLENRGWTNIRDAEKAAEAGRSLGIKYVLLVTVHKAEYTEVPLKTEQKNAFEAFSENILNPYTGTYSAITKFRKVTYDDTYEQRTYKMEVTYQLVSSADGKVVKSDRLFPEQTDAQHQFVYKGNINNVYEELPVGNYLPPVNQAWRDLFTNTRRAPLTSGQLAHELNRQVAGQIASAVAGFFQ
jgi:tetratricopeptide (TPR) repeat protein